MNIWLYSTPLHSLILETYRSSHINQSVFAIELSRSIHPINKKNDIIDCGYKRAFPINQILLQRRISRYIKNKIPKDEEINMFIPNDISFEYRIFIGELKQITSKITMYEDGLGSVIPIHLLRKTKISPSRKAKEIFYSIIFKNYTPNLIGFREKKYTDYIGISDLSFKDERDLGAAFQKLTLRQTIAKHQITKSHIFLMELLSEEKLMSTEQWILYVDNFCKSVPISELSIKPHPRTSDEILKKTLEALSKNKIKVKEIINSKTLEEYITQSPGQQFTVYGLCSSALYYAHILFNNSTAISTIESLPLETNNTILLNYAKTLSEIIQKC